jgi:Domain of unknown function (DUF3361)
MSHSFEVDGSASSSDWESASVAVTSTRTSTRTRTRSAETSSQTLNFSPEDPPAHEPPSLVPSFTPFGARLAPSVESDSDRSPQRQLTSINSLQTSLRLERQRQHPQPEAVDHPSRTPSSFTPGDVSRPVFLLPTPTYNVACTGDPANFAGMETVHVPELVERLGSEEDAVRKMAVFKLQSNIGDPSFAEMFIHEGGLQKLKYLALHATGNTLAYSLTSFSRLLEVDKGWDFVEQDLIERVGDAMPSVWLSTADQKPGCRAGGDPPAGQHPARGHVRSGSDSVTSVPPQSII